MGGTSTDVALIDEGLPLTMESTIADYPVKVPMIDIHTVGAGGGSIATIDVGGSLKVGPESSGADPGPICYGKGNDITVTDANLFLGRLIPDHFLGGTMELDTTNISSHFDALANELGLSVEELAEGVLAVANTTMERAIKVISVERGYDPREFTLFSFGGAGGLHAAYLARGLNIPRVFIPCNPGILSAFGMLMSDIIKDYSQTVMLADEDATSDTLEGQFLPLEDRGQDDLLEEGVLKHTIVLHRYLDMRYQGQSYEIMVPYEGDFRNSFHELHKKTYGYCNWDKAVEVVNVRVRAVGQPDKPAFTKAPFAGEHLAEDAVVDVFNVVFDAKTHPTRIIQREKLKHGNLIQGPAILIEYSSTIVVPPFTNGRVDAFGNIILTLET